MVLWGMMIKYEDGEPCGHFGCERHVSHPCEGCGRINARGESRIMDIVAGSDTGCGMAGREYHKMYRESCWRTYCVCDGCDYEI